jgi:3-hydroxyisobutyrate dehydrogenase
MPRPVAVTLATPVGWIGTGVMGAPMCGHLLARGYAVTVYTRTRAKAEPLLARGARWADTPRAVAERSEVVITMVGFPPDVREVYFGAEGLLSAARPGMIFIDMTTTEPSLAREIHRAAGAREAFALDAPVSGGDVGARQATLAIMVGGDREAFDAVRPLLDALGKQIVYQGGPGAGQHTKMCNQIVIASTMIGMCEALLYGFKAGLSLETMLASIRGGAAGCWSLDHYAPRILQRNFEPGFFVDHFVKDMAIALEEARRMSLPLPGLALAHQLYVALQAQGHGRKGTHALMLALERLAATTIDSRPAEATAERS